MNNGRPRPGIPDSADPRVQLNTYIYDYLLKSQEWKLARSFCSKMSVNVEGPIPKMSPSQNGVDPMDTDSKDSLNERPDDLPSPRVPDALSPDICFLLDWWCQFWDIYSAARSKGKSSPAHQYLAHSRAQAQMRNDTQQRMLMTGNMNQYSRNMMQMQNGMMPNDLQRKAMSNNRNPTPQQLQQMQTMKNQAMMSAQMQRDGSGMDMSGQRPQSPSSVDNAPSPNKRPRLEGNAFNGQPMGAARSQGMTPQQMGATSAAQAGQPMLLQDGLGAGGMAGNNFNGFASQTSGQQKSIEGMNPGVQQGSPMGQPGGGLDGSHEIFAGNPNNRIPNGATGQPQGNHALQDYQMQLMLLEQQNKKRLLMARQEQDSIGQASHGQPPPGFGAPAMSPQGSRAGPSPNPNEQMKRGTPKMNQPGLPGSPMPDGSMQQNRNSPLPSGFDPNQMPGVPPQYYQMPGGNMMRPPSSHPNFNGQGMSQQQMEALRGRMPNGAGGWPQGPPQMMQNQGQQPVPMRTPQQQNSAMPPPPAPAGGEPGRTQPSSPAQAPAPPTPSQAAKPNPRKKDTKETKKKPAKKSAATAGATPASEADPTPSTPTISMHPSSFNNQNGAGPQPNVQPQAPAAAPAPQVQPPPMDNNPGAPFGNISEDNNFDLNFGPLDGPDVLENFDFDSFLHTEDSGAFGSLGNDFNFGPDGVEASTGDL